MVNTDALASIIWGIGPAPFRLELYFLPGASRDDCIAHYHVEKAARGDYMPQAEAASALPSDDEDDDLDAGEAGNKPSREVALPGLVPSYRDRETDAYHSVLYIVHGPECPVTGQKARRILFDAVTQAEWDAVMTAFGELEEEVKRIYEAKEQSLEETGTRMLEDAHFKTEDETNEPWQRAANRNWTSW
ncbi:hypothetical protein ColLi_00248 [Colletotrichum liriopes]|uniref:Uncharacterized protein n=1 Tax=Colletotrichum liriopes TaxID=708192 RepID=A0AA37LLV2_9PEZI|nr:hypothetical protein ColLi_00248 [Colletotrichum liriopes]